MTQPISPPPSPSGYRLLAVLPLILAVGAALLLGLGFLWSIFFDTPGHAVAALTLLPALVASLIYSLLILAALRHDMRCRRLSIFGVIATALVLVISLCLLILQAMNGPKVTGSLQNKETEQAAPSNGG
jgi:membrane protein CcdC involved in cytochrome C biogenesis